MHYRAGTPLRFGGKGGDLMANYITVDGGTTHTRLYLVCNLTVSDTVKLAVGARDGAEALTLELRHGIADLLAKNGLCEQDILRILASGMITSEQGLCNLPHITLPAGKRELHNSLYETVLPNISTIPWCFVRGVKSVGTSLADFDVMRGEETELMGLLSDCEKETLFVLPGSHSKHIQVDEAGRITAFQTMMTGELLAALLEHTILKFSTSLSHSQTERASLVRGYEYCHAHGVNEAIFKARILRNLLNESAEGCYSFLLGAVLHDEINAILRKKAQRIVLAGQKQLREAMALLLRTLTDREIVCLDDVAVEFSTSRGAIRIFEA